MTPTSDTPGPRPLARAGCVRRSPAASAACCDVLAVAPRADGSSLRRTLRQAPREARRWETTTLGYPRHTSDPTLRAIAVEDAAVVDAIASLLIGRGRAGEPSGGRR
jgi:hypothetical protein